MRYAIAIATIVLSMCMFASLSLAAKERSVLPAGAVIETVTFKLKDGVSFAKFGPIDKAVEVQHVSKQPGFLARQSAAGDGGEWLVIVHWRSAKEADASMSTFMQAPAAKTFMDHIDASTMVMKRYMPQ